MIEIFDDANSALQTNLGNFNLFDIFLQINIDLESTIILISLGFNRLHPVEIPMDCLVLLAY